MNKTLRLKTRIDENIKQGDTVRLFDGSSLTCDMLDRPSVYIVNSYPLLTGSDEMLKNIDCEVIEIGITDKISVDTYSDWCYLQDILIKIGNGYFRTSSKFVAKV